MVDSGLPRETAVIRLAVKLSLGALLLPLVAAACAGPQTPLPPATETPSPASTPLPTATATPEPAVPSVAVSIWLSWKPAGVRAFNELMQAFQSRFPQAEVSVSYIPQDELRSALEQASVDDSLPSIVMAPSRWAPELFEAGIIVDLSDQATDELKATIHPLAWSQVESEGRVLGVPVQMHGNVLYRNRQLANVPAATVEGLIATAQRFRGTANVGQGLDFGFEIAAPFSLACGGQLIRQGAPPDLESEVAPCWLGLIKELSLAGPVTFNTQEDRERFELGQAGWLIESTERYDDFRNALGSDALAVDPWPLYQATGEPLAGFVWTENAYFRPGLSADQLGMAWELVTSLVSAEAQTALSNPTGAANLPVRAASIPLLGAPAQMYDAIIGGLAFPLWSPNQGHVEILERAARAVSVQGATVETALRRAIDELADV